MPSSPPLAAIFYTLQPDDPNGQVLGLINVPLEYVSEKLIAIAGQGGELFDVEFSYQFKADTSDINLPTLVTDVGAEEYGELIQKYRYPNG